jgi:hypothetical protein
MKVGLSTDRGGDSGAFSAGSPAILAFFAATLTRMRVAYCIAAAPR